jgi:hypothetical protein
LTETKVHLLPTTVARRLQLHQRLDGACKDHCVCC